jgi:hypothetical protein
VRLSHTLARISAVFDDPNLVSHGGLGPVAAWRSAPGCRTAREARAAAWRVRGKHAAEGGLPGGGHDRGRRLLLDVHSSAWVSRKALSSSAEGELMVGSLPYG